MRGSSTSVRRHMGVDRHERGGITQSIRGCVVGNVVQLSPSTTSTGTQLDPVGPAPNRLSRVRSMRQERPPIPHFVLHKNPIADLIASTVDQAIAAAISTTVAVPNASSKPLTTISAASKQSPTAPAKLALPRPNSTPKAQTVSTKQASSKPALPKKSSAIVSYPADQLQHNSFMEVFYAMKEAQKLSMQPLKQPMPASKATLWVENQEKIELQADVASGVAPPKLDTSNIRNVPTSELVLSPHRPDSRPGEASSWTDGRLNSVSFTSGETPSEPSPERALEETVVYAHAHGTSPQAGTRPMGLGISIPDQIMSGVDNDALPANDVAKSPTVPIIDLMDEPVEQIKQDALRPLLPIQEVPVKQIINGIPYILVREDQLLQIRQLPDSSRLVPTTATAVRAASNLQHITIGAGTLGGSILGDHNLPGRGGAAQQTSPTKQSDSWWAYNHKARESRDYRPQRAQAQAHSRWDPLEHTIVDEFTPFDTATRTSSRDTEMSGLGEAESSTNRSRLFSCQDRDNTNCQETQDERLVRMMQGRAGAGMTLFGAAATTPSGQQAAQSLTGRKLRPVCNGNLQSSKYAHELENTAAPTIHGVLSNNGSAAARQKPPISKWATGRLEELKPQSPGIRESTSPIFGDRKNMQSRNYESQWSNMTGANDCKATQCIAPGAGVELSKKDLAKAAMQAIGQVGIHGDAGGQGEMTEVPQGSQ
jgi:hypothetical protein